MVTIVGAARRHPELEPFVVVTDPAPRRLDRLHEGFGIRPAAELDLGGPDASPHRAAAAALTGLEPVLADLDPHAVVVQGDTPTALFGGFAAHLAGVPVVHADAGLADGAVPGPFATFHLAPTPVAAERLRGAGVDPGAVRVTGSTLVDALSWIVPRAADASPEHLARAVRTGVAVVLHVSRTPGTAVDDARAAAARRGAERAGAVFERWTGPIDEAPFGAALAASRVVVTDVGVVQEAASGLGVPAIVPGEAVARPEAIAAGCALRPGPDDRDLERAVADLVRDDALHRGMAEAPSPYGDGEAGSRAAESIAWLLGRGPAPLQFGRP